MAQALNFKRKSGYGAANITLPLNSFEVLKNWEYHLLVVDDQLNYQSSTQSHRYICTQLARQLAALLFLSHQQFFKVLHMQEDLGVIDEEEQSREDGVRTFRLRDCLSSCLEVFSRSSYLIFSDEKSQIGSLSTTITTDSTKENAYSCKSRPKEEREGYWQKLKEIVLMVLKRISCAVSSEDRIVIINGQYLSTCKLLDICLIYGQKYKTDVTEIVRNLFAKGSELEDFQKDFKRVLDLAYQKMKQLCEEFEGFSEIDFVKLKENNKLYRNFHNAESTLSKSITKLFFSTYDLLRNLEAILEYFPSRCKVQLLENPLILKRFIMIYNKIRYFDESHWQFGVRESYFRPLISEIINRIVTYLETAMVKISMLIRQLPPNKPHREELKKSFVNFWHFTFISPAISYEFKDSEARISKALQHGKELGYLVLRNRPSELFSNALLSAFNRYSKSFESMKPAAMMCKQIYTSLSRIKAIEKAEAWRLPSFASFLKSIEESKAKQPALLLKQRKLLDINSKQYEDEPAQGEEQAQSNEEQHMYTCYEQMDQLNFLSMIQDLENSVDYRSKDSTQKTNSDRHTEEGIHLEVSLSSIEGDSEHILSHVFNDSKAFESDSMECSILT